MASLSLSEKAAPVSAIARKKFLLFIAFGFKM